MDRQYYGSAVQSSAITDTAKLLLVAVILVGGYISPVCGQRTNLNEAHKLARNGLS